MKWELMMLSLELKFGSFDWCFSSLVQKILASLMIEWQNWCVLINNFVTFGIESVDGFQINQFNYGKRIYSTKFKTFRVWLLVLVGMAVVPNFQSLKLQNLSIQCFNVLLRKLLFKSHASKWLMISISLLCSVLFLFVCYFGKFFRGLVPTNRRVSSSMSVHLTQQNC